MRRGMPCSANFGMKIFVAARFGQGIAVNTRQERNLHEDAGSAGGLGIGVKKFRLVWVFLTETALNGFINSGWELGSQATGSSEVR